MRGINRAKRQIYVEPSFDDEGRQIIPPRVLGYDTLILAVGSVCNDFGTPGVADHAVKLDSIVDAVKRIGGLKLFVGGGRAFRELSPAQRAKLRALFRPEVEELETMLSRKFAAWK